MIYQLVGGGEVALQPPDDPLSRSRWLAVASLDRGDTAIGRTAAGPADRGRIQLAVAVDDSAAEAALRDRTADLDEVFWDGSRREVRAVRRRKIVRLVRVANLPAPAAAMTAAAANGIPVRRVAAAAAVRVHRAAAAEAAAKVLPAAAAATKTPDPD